MQPPPLNLALARAAARPARAGPARGIEMRRSRAAVWGNSGFILSGIVNSLSLLSFDLCQRLGNRDFRTTGLEEIVFVTFCHDYKFVKVE